MTYVFVFLGEFGYELLNWQGVVRKCASTLSPHDQLICCSRGNVYPLYEAASRYVDISAVPLFKDSVASGYYALHGENLGVHSASNLEFDRRLRAELSARVLEEIRESPPGRCRPGGRIRGLWSALRARGDVRVIFSSERTRLNGCDFGCTRARYGVDVTEGNIYELLDVRNNLFRRIEPDLGVRATVEQKLPWDLSEPFILCQTRTRAIGVRSHDLVPKDRLIDALGRKTRVVLLSFRTGRNLDSYSSFAAHGDAVEYRCDSFAEQACLIHFARKCVFFTEGDFGSHIYVPPLMGRDVIAIGPRSVFEIGTTPIEFWNREVFRFGGQIIARPSEETFESSAQLASVVDAALSP